MVHLYWGIGNTLTHLALNPLCPQVPRESEEEKIFLGELPILELFGSPRCIQANIPYDVDSDVQLVCKYLWACKVGCLRKKIDRLYMDGLDPVKFSTDHDLSDMECHMLLQEYMPQHIANTKITQKLFIRYALWLIKAWNVYK